MLAGRSIVLLAGGLFLLWKASHEIFVEVEAREQDHAPDTDAATLKAAGQRLFWGIIGQIAIIDIVFSLDSVITAVGMVSHVPVMIAAATATKTTERKTRALTSCKGGALLPWNNYHKVSKEPR